MISRIRTFFSRSNLPWFGSLLAGGAAPFAFSPYYLWPIVILSLASLILLATKGTPKQAFHRGYAFGLGFFGVGVWWIYIALRYFGNAAPILAMLLTLLFVCYLALFPALATYCQRRYAHGHTIIVFPCLWVLFEWLRGWLLTGFPWLFVGYSTIKPLAAFAPIGGIYLMSYITVIIASFVSELTNRKAQKTTNILIVIGIFSFGHLGKNIEWVSPLPHSLTVSLLQGNIGKELKWNPQKSLDNIESYIGLSRKHWDSDFIVWPEGTFSLPQTYARNLLDQLNDEAKEHNTTIGLGIPYVENGRYYNSLMLIGNGSGLYSKRHLVPFGEFTPLSFMLKPMLSWLKIPMSDYSRGAKNQALLNVNGIKIAPFICYEIVYPGIVNRDLPEAQILLTISEDAWYGDSNAVDQHLQMAQMRSLESGRYSLFAVNTGISAIIDEHGKILNSIPLNTRGAITKNIPAFEGTTPWALMGNGPWLSGMLALVVVGVIL